MNRNRTFKDIIRYRNWDNIELGDDKPAESIVQSIEERLKRQARRSGMDGEMQFTDLQMKAFNNKDFWGEWNEATNQYEGKNLIVQGATSAGKTLVSEMLLVDTLVHGRTAIVLVPLKSMVRERLRRFHSDFLAGNFNRVYASSSDYMDHDEALLNGEYDLAVMIYEKFFAMLCQPDCKLLDRCQLIVVDELSMLQVKQRGPKLEIAIENALGRADPPRIVCLATVDCDVSCVNKWLYTPQNPADLHNMLQPIKSEKRPVPLYEYLVRWDGSYSMYCTEDPDGRPEKGKLEVAIGGEKPLEIRKKLLKAILQRLYPDTPKNGDDTMLPKTLVFVPTQNLTRQIAREIETWGLNLQADQKTNKITREDRDRIEELKINLRYCDPDQDLAENTRLLRHGISYHHGSMSTNLREIVEELFSIDPSCKIIVATATLTVGVNLPLDTVILFDTKVPDESSRDVPITQQEYQNFIGRAGRLGVSNRNRRAESYLIAMTHEEETYWQRHHPLTMPIQSALLGWDEVALAPYYLCLLLKNHTHGGLDAKFTPSRIEEIYNRSLSHACNKGKAVDADKMIKVLEQSDLVIPPDAHTPDFLKKYQLNFYGRTLAPYALSLLTTWMMRNAFIDPGKPNEKNGLVKSLAGEIDKDTYLPDILFCICRNDEIVESSNLALRENNNLQTKSALYNGLCRLVGREPSEDDQAADDVPDDVPSENAGADDPADSIPAACKLWEGSDLGRLFLDCIDKTPEHKDYCALYRTLLMYFWTKGYPASRIRKMLRLRESFSNGDLERLAEAVSFQLDAAACIMINRVDVNKSEDLLIMISAMRRLSSRVKYGVPGELVIFANRHVHGLDRASILLLGSVAKEKGMEPIDYLRKADAKELLTKTHITNERRETLLQRLQDRFSSRSLLKLDELNASAAFKTRLEKLYDFSSSNSDELFDLLKEMFAGNVLEDGSKLFFGCSSISNKDSKTEKIYPSGSILWEFLDGTKSKGSFLLTYCYQDDNNPVNWTIPVAPDKHQIVLFNGDRCPSKLSFNSHVCGKAPESGLTCQNLAELIASSIVLGQENAVNLLYTVLKDAAGFQNSLRLSWLNYDAPVQHKEDAEYLLVMDSDSPIDKDMEQALNRDPVLEKHRLVPWGEAGKAFNEAKPDEFKPTVILLDMQTIRHHAALHDLIYKINSHDAHDRCLILARESNEIQKWKDPADAGSPGLDWPGYPKFQVEWYRTIEEKRRAVRLFLRRWKEHKNQHQFTVAVSYPHYDAFGKALSEWANPGLTTDNGQLFKIVERLNQEFGEDSVLFDENTQAKKLFNDKAIALKSYKECLAGVALYNNYGANNSWCPDERAAMHEGGVKIFYLTTTDTPDGKPNTEKMDADNERTLPAKEEEIEQLIRDVKKAVIEAIG